MVDEPKNTYDLQCQMNGLTAFEIDKGNPILIWFMPTTQKQYINCVVKVYTDRSGDDHKIVEEQTLKRVFTNYVIWTGSNLKDNNNSSSMSRMIQTPDYFVWTEPGQKIKFFKKQEL